MKEFARVILVEDHPIVRERLVELIAEEPDLVVCGEADDAPHAFEMIAATGPDLVVVDLSLKHSDGLDLVKSVRSAFPKVAVLVISMRDEAIWAERAIRAGANGYVNKHEGTKDIVRAIRAALAGEFYLSDALAQRMIARAASRAAGPVNAGVESLADRELQVFEMIGQGFSSRQIAKQIRVDTSTVDTYRARIKEKLRLQGSSMLLQHAIAWVQEVDGTKKNADCRMPIAEWRQ